MALGECIRRVLDGYAAAQQEEFTGHPLASFLRHDFCRAVEAVCGDNGRLIVKGSPGMGNWARGPWVGVFDRLITSGAQGGYYPVYLFREDMQGLYLSLNQGMTVLKRQYKSDAKTALRARAGNFRAMLGTALKPFPELDIDLAPSAPSNDTAFYEAGNICAKYYPARALPDEATLASDLSAMLSLYDGLVQQDVVGDPAAVADGDEPAELDYEDATRFRVHKRIERNSDLAKRAKQLLGFRCQVCGADFEKRYGAVGKEFIEAHHLRPLASLKGKKVAMDPAKDFAVLCPNCHRMVHRSGCVDDIEKFKKEHYRG